jgi:hypothetical protein
MPPVAPPETPSVPLRRLLLLTVLTAAIAFALQAMVVATSAPFAGAIVLFVTPLVAAAVVFAWLQPYPLAGRLRLAAMVGVALFVVGLGL